MVVSMQAGVRRPPSQHAEGPNNADDDWDEDGNDEFGSLVEDGEEDESAPQNPDAPEEAEFYDPLLDERDEAWMQRQRGGRKSDAILSCPSCFTTVCLDCQQHHTNEGQYRAMFCMNVRWALLFLPLFSMQCWPQVWQSTVPSAVESDLHHASHYALADIQAVPSQTGWTRGGQCRARQRGRGQASDGGEERCRGRTRARRQMKYSTLWNAACVTRIWGCKMLRKSSICTTSWPVLPETDGKSIQEKMTPVRKEELASSSFLS